MFWFLTLWKMRKSKFNLAYFIIFLYAIIALGTLYLYHSDYYTLYYNRNLNLFSFIYLFLMIILTTSPLINMKEKRISTLVIPSSKSIDILTSVVAILVIVSMIGLLPDIIVGFKLMLIESEDIQFLYHYSTVVRKSNRAFEGSINIINVLSNIANGISPLLFYTYLIKTQKKKWILLLISISLLRSPLQGIATASRALLVLSLLQIVVFFFFFKPFIDANLKKRIKRISIILFSGIFIILATITMVRVAYTGKTDLLFNVLRYFSGAPIVFNNYCLNANGTRQGYLTAPLFNHLIGMPSLSEEEIRYKYSYMSVDNSRFSTYVGDFVLDYGPVVTVVLFILFAIICNFILKNRGRLYFYQICIVFLVSKFCTGYFQYLYTSVLGNLIFLTLIFMSLFFYINKGNRIGSGEIITRKE